MEAALPHGQACQPRGPDLKRHREGQGHKPLKCEGPSCKSATGRNDEVSRRRRNVHKDCQSPSEEADGSESGTTKAMAKETRVEAKKTESKAKETKGKAKVTKTKTKTIVDKSN